MNDLLSREYSSKGWTPERVAVFREEFSGFLNVCKVNSKEVGPMVLGENLYHAQHRFLDFVFDCLSKDIHDIKHLKSRQLGVSTISRALTLFWAGVHDGLRGYMVYDTQPHTEEARLELIEMLVNLPDEYAFPRIARQNRYMVRLENDTVINFASAGVKESKSSGTLGRSSGINFHHGSEICSWHGGESIESYKNALAKTFPNRLYVWESTGRGPNIWKDMCDEAENDPHHQAFLFSGWWCHNLQRIERDDPDYERYTSSPLSDAEHRRIRAVYERYGHTITPEQLAWIRRYMDPGREVDEGERSTDEIFRLREQAWTSDEAWLLTSRGFFPAQELSDIKRSHGSNRFRAYTYSLGLEFHHTRISPTINPRLFELKVWDEPQEGACYIVSADVAHGANEHNDHSTAQVLRAYADGLDQVAEFSSPVVNTTQYAWVLASLAGWYAGSTSQVTVIIEIQGGGDATWREFQGLKRRIAQGYQAEEIRERGLQNLFHNVRNYMYTRSDSIGGASRNYQWKCLALDTVLPTPQGWTTMAALKAGDVLFDDKGETCRVLAAHPVLLGHKCCRVVFDDGAEVVCDEEHLWPIGTKRDILTTSELAAGRWKLDSDGPPSIRLNDPLQMPARFLPVDPYVLGFWLGDGHQGGGRFTAHIDDMAEVSRHLSAAGAFLGPITDDKGQNTQSRTILKLRGSLNHYGLLRDKRIPPDYLRASLEQRVALLQGLMDTDGTVSTKSEQCSFTSSNPRLADGFCELLTTLGIKFSRTARNRTLSYNGREVPCAEAYQISFSRICGLPAFRLRRKLAVQQSGFLLNCQRLKRRTITAINSIASVPVRCIEVDSPSHLYLVTRSMIPTHNTNYTVKPSMMEQMRGYVMSQHLIIRSEAAYNQMQAVVREGDSISAATGRDDNVISLAIGCRCWDEQIRPRMVTQRRTREIERARTAMSISDMSAIYNKNVLEAMFAVKYQERLRERAVMAAEARRYGGRRRR